MIPLESLPDFALRNAIGAVCVSALVLAATRLLRQRAEPVRYGVLFGGIIGLLAMPAMVALGQLCQDTFARRAVTVDTEIVRVPVEMLPVLLQDGPEVEDAVEPTSFA